jgi:hypothetical protein
MKLILYSKPGCHLCEGLQEKLEQISSLEFTLEVRDITTCDDWFQAYEYEIPVLVLEKRQEPEITEAEQLPRLISLPRPSPRASVRQLEQMLRTHGLSDRAQ